jgi:hypothetical protein
MSEKKNLFYEMIKILFHLFESILQCHKHKKYHIKIKKGLQIKILNKELKINMIRQQLVDIYAQ